jgi:excisionase family DNA binding protein
MGRWCERERNVVSALIDALLAELDDHALATLADKLAPWLVDQLGDPRPDDGWLRGADAIARYLGCPRSRVYALTSAGRIPIHRDGSNLVARAVELDVWVRSGGGKRP